MYKNRYIIPGIILLTVFLFSFFRHGFSEAAPVSTASYMNDIAPLLKSRCGSCHTGDFVNKDLHFDSYDLLMAGSQNGPVIIPGDAENSILVQKLESGEMPKQGPRLTPTQIELIREWIDAGALDN